MAILVLLNTEQPLVCSLTGQSHMKSIDIIYPCFSCYFSLYLPCSLQFLTSYYTYTYGLISCCISLVLSCDYLTTVLSSPLYTVFSLVMVIDHTPPLMLCIQLFITCGGSLLCLIYPFFVHIVDNRFCLQNAPAHV